MKKSVLVTLVMAFLVFMASSQGLAQVTGVADTSKEGSVLIWPFVQVASPNGGDGNETYIFINNGDAGGGESGGVHIKCYWEIKSDPADLMSTCFVTDFAFFLSINNPVIFRASNGAGLDGRSVAAGMGEGVGALKCWAVDPTETKQISWDHLSGSAMILDSNLSPETIDFGQTTAFQYNAYRFAANVLNSDNSTADGFQMGKVSTTFDFDDPNIINLKGLSATGKPKYIPAGVTCADPYDQPQCSSFTDTWRYDACPKYQTFDFLSEYDAQDDSGYAHNYLALVPCKEDLRDSEFDIITAITFTIWNENEVKYTGTYKCSNCEYNTALATITTTSGTNMFKEMNLHTASGRFRVEGKKNETRCAPASNVVSLNTPLLGVLAAQLVNFPENLPMDSVDLVATTGTGGGASTDDDLPGYIKWVPTGLPWEKIKR